MDPLPELARPCPTARDDISEAWAAQRETRAKFVEVAHQGPEVRRISSEFKGLRERNGFGKLLTKTMGLK